MIFRVSLGLIFTLQLGLGQKESKEPLRGLAEHVSVLPLGTNGETLDECRIKWFVDLQTKDDRSDQFQGLSGKSIPYGEYSVYASCAGTTGASSIVLVNRPDAFVVVSSSRHVSDYAPGHGPVFRIEISNWRDFGSDQLWAQLIGVFRDERLVDRVHRDSGKAFLAFELPGSYILTIFSGGEVLCREPLRIENVGGGLAIRIDRPCYVEQTAGVTLMEDAPRIVERADKRPHK